MKRRSGVCLSGVAVALGVPAAIPSTAAAACRTYEHRAIVESAVFKTNLAYLYITERMCFNGKRITKVGKLRVRPDFTDNSVNESFEGLDYAPIREFRSWRGSRRGSHYTKAAGTFKQEICVGPCYTATSHIWVSMQVYGNGTVKKDRKND